MRIEEKLTVTPSEAMSLLGIGRNAIYRLLSSGQIRAKKIGKRKWIISRKELESWLSKIDA